MVQLITPTTDWILSQRTKKVNKLQKYADFFIAYISLIYNTEMVEQIIDL